MNQQLGNKMEIWYFFFLLFNCWTVCIYRFFRHHGVLASTNIINNVSWLSYLQDSGCLGICFLLLLRLLLALLVCCCYYLCLRLWTSWRHDAMTPDVLPLSKSSRQNDDEEQETISRCRDPSSEARQPGAYTSWCAYVAIVQPTVAVGMGPKPRHRQHLFSYIYTIMIIIICVWKCTAVSARSNTSFSLLMQPTNMFFLFCFFMAMKRWQLSCTDSNIHSMYFIRHVFL